MEQSGDNATLGTRSSVLGTRSSVLGTRYFVLAARLALVLTLAAVIVGTIAASRAGLAWRAGEQLLTAEHYQAAEHALEDAINRAPSGGAPGYDADRARLALSWAYLARRDTARAAAVLPVPAPAALLPAVLLQRGRVAGAAGDRAAAQAWFTALIAAPLPGGTTPAARAARRAALWHRGEIAWAAGAPTAEADFAALTADAPPAHDPYAAAAWLRLAALRARRDPAAARQALAAARATLPVDASLVAAPDLGLAALDLAEGLSPATLVTQIVGLDADLRGDAAVEAAGAGALDVYWGRALASLEAWPQAALLLGRAVAADPTLADAHAYLGLAQERLGQAVPAELSYRTAMRLAPDRPLAAHLLARLLIAQGRLTEAKPLLDTVLGANPGSVVIYLDLADWALAQGQYDQAEIQFQAAEQAQADHEAAHTASPAEQDLNTSLLLAQFYFQAGALHHDCSLARDAAGRAVTRHPGAAEYDALGWAQHLCGDDTAAQATLGRAVALDPRLAPAQYHLGVVDKARQDPAARPALAAAQDLDPGGIWERRALAALVSP